MGKNAGHKAMQSQRYSSGAGAGDDAAGAPPAASTHQEADVTYHTPAWHAARIASLVTNRMSWDEFRKQQRELQDKEDAVVGSEKALREHRATLDAERAARLGLRAPAAAKDPEKKKRERLDRRGLACRVGGGSSGICWGCWQEGGDARAARARAPLCSGA
ncbi:MAG: hypothetical protein J3K34DRAFT_86823 [Monoraphidium minutum]|nr:MAG: hypothetical protein J3K34DRAFT_86823 [Monoraphidium minutum]